MDFLPPWLWPYDKCFFLPGFAWPGEAEAAGMGAFAARLNSERDRLGATHAPEFIFSTESESFSALDYERRCSEGLIPTRDISHDWYNGVVWLHFWRTKQWINHAHIRDGAAHGSQGFSPVRSRFRDALTLFDENGAVLFTTSPAISRALLEQDWNTLFLVHREAWADSCRLLLFGHGLLDSLHRPHRGLCAKVIPVVLPRLPETVGEQDALLLRVVGHIQDPLNFSPLPVMGVPGWFEESDTPGYYNDKSVYRAKATPRRISPHERLAFEWDAPTLADGKCAGQSLPDTSGGGKSGLQ